MKVRYITKGEYTGDRMTVLKEYTVIGIEADYYRIIADDNEPYLYNPNQFTIIEKTVPNFWITEIGEDGEKYSYPSTWVRVGFFEDYFDNIESVKEQFWKECSELYGIAQNA